jgi:hypothetical protein
MRFARFGLLIFLLFGVSAWAQQPTASQQATSTQPASDPQAVAVVQAAINALGGATAISQTQSWTFQAQMQGMLANGNVSYTLSGVVGTQPAAIVVNGVTKKVKADQSLFVPAVLAYVLLSEFQDQSFPLRFGGQVSLSSEAVAVVTFSDPDIPALPAQKWYFDTATSLPTRVEFQLPAAVGSKMSFTGVVEVSDYKSIGGVLYPFKIVTRPEREQPEATVLQSVSPSAATLSNDFNGAAGDR